VAFPGQGRGHQIDEHLNVLKSGAGIHTSEKLLAAMATEFIILADTGESAVFCHKDLVDMPAPGHDLDWDNLGHIFEGRTSLYAATEEMHDPVLFADVPADKQVSARGIEVGHIFYFGEKYSKPMRAVVNGPEGEITVHMGSYGIGVSRLLGAIIEASHDDAGIIWPESVAPFDCAIINLRVGDAICDAACEKAYAALTGAGKDVLYHDTDDRPGAKFASMDLIGVPQQLIIGPKGLAEGLVELKSRASGERQSLSLEAALSRLTGA